MHEYFGLDSEIDNDIALVFLEKHVEFGYNVKKVIITRPLFEKDHINKLLVTGWSHTVSTEYNKNVLFI